MTFDIYIQRFAKASVAFSAFCALLVPLAGCGGLAGGLFTLMHVPVLIVGMGLPLLWRLFKKIPLAADSKRRAWYTPAGIAVVTLFVILFDRSSNSGCFR